MENIKTLSNQEVFDKAACHLLAQNQKSVSTPGTTIPCLYRGPNGLMCAAGPFIPDEMYQEDMEKCGTWDQLILVYPILGNVGNPDLISDLQVIHDASRPCVWKSELKAVARFWNLSDQVLEAF